MLACSACGVQGEVSAEIYEALLMLQHRGQDSAGMVTTDGQRFREHRDNGLVREVFGSQSLLDMMTGAAGASAQQQPGGPLRPPTLGRRARLSMPQRLLAAGSTGLGHVRYPTAGSLSAQEAQPFFVNSPLGIYLIHNGNLTNTEELRRALDGSHSFYSRHLRTESDSEVRTCGASALSGACWRKLAVGGMQQLQPGQVGGLRPWQLALAARECPCAGQACTRRAPPAHVLRLAQGSSSGCEVVQWGAGRPAAHGHAGGRPAPVRRCC